MEAASMDLRKMDRLRQGPSDNVLADLSWAYLHRGRKLDAMQLFKRIKTTRMPLLISLMSKFSAERNLPACKELFSFSKVLCCPLLDLIQVGSICRRKEPSELMGCSMRIMGMLCTRRTTPGL
mmetsp:Transcript_31741/g.122998  ORF Transcript_31741/g.122998 Transcript_31741/m.122998 type:complete len:123 (+) Transcript_31741:1182-1550(+)